MGKKPSYSIHSSRPKKGPEGAMPPLWEETAILEEHKLLLEGSINKY